MIWPKVPIDGNVLPYFAAGGRLSIRTSHRKSSHFDRGGHCSASTLNLPNPNLWQHEPVLIAVVDDSAKSESLLAGHNIDGDDLYLMKIVRFVTGDFLRRSALIRLIEEA